MFKSDKNPPPNPLVLREGEQESSDPAREGGSLSSLRADFDKNAWQTIKTKKHCHTDGA
ncbi:hypothetical protein [Helicobacter sp. T3_23-1059]